MLPSCVYSNCICYETALRRLFSGQGGLRAGPGDLGGPLHCNDPLSGHGGGDGLGLDVFERQQRERRKEREKRGGDVCHLL